VTDYEEYTAAANARTAIGVLLESTRAVDNLDEILRVEGIDFALVGHKDLSQSLGYPAQTHHPVVMENITTILRKTREAGLAPAVGVSRVKQAEPFIKLGARIVLIGKDMGLLYRAYSETLAQARRLM
jgi:2-keto-3-deoxy-L-rhamnonate aldolase RhmA